MVIYFLQMPLNSQCLLDPLSESEFYQFNYLTNVHPQMVDFGSGQGLSDFETGGIACYFEDFKRAKTPPRAERCRLWMDTN